MKKIYRISEPKKKMIAGICAGIADMFTIDPTIVRLGLVFACVLTGFVPLLVTYAIGWVIIPEKLITDSSDKNVA